MAEFNLDALEQIFVILNTLGTLVLIILFWKTIKHLEESSRLAKLQSNYRFRPWIGPINSIKRMPSTNEKHQFVVEIKNYGEIPSTKVVGRCKIKNELMQKSIVKNTQEMESFDLGPLLPNMEKKYWIFVDSDSIQKAKDGSTQIFVAIYFEYEYASGKSGYGMISQYDPKTDGFLHKEMWVD